MNDKLFEWNDKFQQGIKSENEFIYLYKGPQLTKHTSREYDFDREDGKRVELKSDQYSIEKTPNFFIERYSVYEQRKLGSLWQSVDKADIFIYYYCNSGVYFEFDDISSTIRTVERYLLVHQPRPILIPNRGYNGMGYRIPRHVLKHLYHEVTC